ncbi:MAG: hypothetical protein A4S09_13425 [Proteobacteria bacterium SG_bin7]|nr:MAG: hypothetical protein A4S09_13425 [Proteobacteria bacterium SG_bin7]
MKNLKDEGVVIRLLELKQLIERLHFRYGMKTKEIARQLNLRESSVRKFLKMQILEERIEI